MSSIKFDNVSFQYNQNEPLFDGLSCSFQNPTPDKGHIISLMGASGSGKSTFLKLILKTLIPNKGEIILNPTSPIVSYLPQESVLFDFLTPLDNAQYFKSIDYYKSHFNNVIFEELAEILGMTKVLKNTKNINDLSGGQRQRLALLRAISIKPNILLLDEPTSGLDSDVKIHFLHLLRQIVESQKILTIYVTHHKLETEMVADEVAYIYKNNKNNSLQLFKDDLLKFIQKPPITEAYRVFNYPLSNLVKFKISESNFLIPSEENSFFLPVTQNNLHFSDNEGIPFNIVSSNSVYTTIEIQNSQYITLNTSKEILNNSKLLINGNVLCYNASHEFLDIKQVNNNKMI